MHTLQVSHEIHHLCAGVGRGELHHIRNAVPIYNTRRTAGGEERKKNRTKWWIVQWKCGYHVPLSKSTAIGYFNTCCSCSPFIC